MKPDELKATMKESPGRYADPLASEVNDKDGFWNTPELECCMVDDFSDGYEKEKLRNSISPCPVPSGLFEKDTDSYTDKNVMECELPELMVCYKETAYHLVKDICIDEGIPSEDNILIDSKDNHEVLCTSLPVDGYKHVDIIKERLDTEFLIQDVLISSSDKDCDMNGIECGAKEKMDIHLLIPDGHNDLCTSLPNNDHSDMNKVSIDTEFLIQDGLKLSSGKDCEEDIVEECGTKKKVNIDLLIPDDTEDDAAYKYGPDGLKLLGRFNTDQEGAHDCVTVDPTQTGEENSNVTDNVMDDISTEELVSDSMLPVPKYRPQTSLKILESSDCGDNDAELQPCQIPVEEISKTPAVVSGAEKLSRSNQTTNTSYDSKVESGTMTFNFDTGKATASTGDGIPENENEHPLQPQNVPSHEDGTWDKFSMASQVQRGEGETSLSVTGPVSGRITCSGPIAFSGSISLRSDSSTTSTRSFAFPVLQSDWNSSPVRMAKADRRHFRKHRGWRQGLLCCRF